MSTIKAKYVSAPVNGATVEPLVVQTNNLDRVTVDSSGNVGVGTTSPGKRLDVDGQFRVRNGGATGYALVEYGTSATATNNWHVGSEGDGSFRWYNGNFGAGIERARIDSSGNLLVNTTSGLGAARFVVEQNTLTANPMAVSNPRSTAATDYAIMFYRNGSLVGSIQTSLSATSYVTSSDYRLKENVKPMTGALAKVEALNPCTYTWKADKTSGQGFIAHELQAVVPDAVTGEKDAVNEDGSIKPQGIDTSFLVATLTAAIQEQQQMINAQQAALETLQAKVAALEAA